MFSYEGSRKFLFVLGIIGRTLQVILHKVLTVVIGSKRNALPPIKDRLLLESAVGLAYKIRSKKLTSKQVVEAHINRIKDVNPAVNAVVEDRFAAAIKDAIAVDEYLAKTNKTEEELANEKPFLGVPFTSKNAIGIKGMIMDSGVALRKGDRTKEDSQVVALMRQAGAIPLCLTNTPEYCMWFDASNTLYGRTNNPYDLTRICGGSSGGEGALTGAAASPVGMGNDIFGSIRMPAYYSGVFGHKPSRKVVSNKGQWPSSYKNDLDEFNVTGPLCKRAEDLLPIMKIMSEDNALLKLNEKVDLKKIRVYYTDKYPSGYNIAPVDAQLEEGIKKVVTYLESVTGNHATKVVAKELTSDIMTCKFSKYVFSNASSMFEMVSGQGPEHFNLPWEYFKWILRVSTHCLNCLVYLTYSKFFLTLKPSMVQAMNEKVDRMDKELKDILGNNGVLIYPNLPEQPYYHQEQFLKMNNCSFTVPFNLTGLPVTQCPVGLSKEGLPLGVQVVGYRYKDRVTMAVARAIEKGFGGWQSPSKVL